MRLLQHTYESFEQPSRCEPRNRSARHRTFGQPRNIPELDMNLFSTTPTQRRLALGLLILRIALGAVFIIHGGQKLFMMGPGGTAGMFTQMGVPGAGVFGPIITFLEPLAGVCVLLGLVTRLAGLAIACDMLGAILTFHIHHGFFVPMGIEFVMMNCAAGLALAALGAGPISIDDAIVRRDNER